MIWRVSLSAPRLLLFLCANVVTVPAVPSPAAAVKNESALPTKVNQAVVTAHGRQYFDDVHHHLKKDTKVRREARLDSELRTGSAGVANLLSRDTLQKERMANVDDCEWDAFEGECANDRGHNVMDGEEFLGTFTHPNQCKWECCQKDECLAVYQKTNNMCFEHTSATVTQGNGETSLSHQLNDMCYIKKKSTTTTTTTTTIGVALQNADAAASVTISEPVIAGSCANRQQTGTTSAQITCDSDLVLTGCSCKATGDMKCDTEFAGGNQCKAYTTTGNEVTATARCCNLPWVPADSWQIVTSDPAVSNKATCPEGKTRTGCACSPIDKTGAGCKGVKAVLDSQTCEGWNSAGQAAGITVQAMCAATKESDKLMVASGDKAGKSEAAPTDLDCDDAVDIMMSCQCVDDDSSTCWGGSIVIQQCQCWGQACQATAVCAKLPVDCTWDEWEGWGECNSSSCESGSRNRTRKQLSPASGGGKQCTAKDAVKLGDCDCGGNDSSGGGGLLIIILIILGVVLIIIIGAGVFMHLHGQSQAKGEHGADYEGEGYGEDYGGGEEW